MFVSLSMRGNSVSVRILFRSLCAPNVSGESVSLKRMGAVLKALLILLVGSPPSPLLSRVVRD